MYQFGPAFAGPKHIFFPLIGSNGYILKSISRTAKAWEPILLWLTHNTHSLSFSPLSPFPGHYPPFPPPRRSPKSPPHPLLDLGQKLRFWEVAAKGSPILPYGPSLRVSGRKRSPFHVAVSRCFPSLGIDHRRRVCVGVVGFTVEDWFWGSERKSHKENHCFLPVQVCRCHKMQFFMAFPDFGCAVGRGFN